MVKMKKRSQLLVHLAKKGLVMKDQGVKSSQNDVWKIVGQENDQLNTNNCENAKPMPLPQIESAPLFPVVVVAVNLFAVQHFEKINSIEHKYLIPGHTQNEGDSVHSVIERHIKKARRSGPIYLPQQYYTLIQTAKKTGKPYKVIELTYRDFLDVKQLAADMGVKVTNITEMRLLKFEKKSPTNLFFKKFYGFPEYETETIAGRRRSTKFIFYLKPAYSDRVGITEKKKNGLLDLILKKMCTCDVSTFL